MGSRGASSGRAAGGAGAAAVVDRINTENMPSAQANIVNRIKETAETGNVSDLQWMMNNEGDVAAAYDLEFRGKKYTQVSVIHKDGTVDENTIRDFRKTTSKSTIDTNKTLFKNSVKGATGNEPKAQIDRAAATLKRVEDRGGDIKLSKSSDGNIAVKITMPRSGTQYGYIEKSGNYVVNDRPYRAKKK